MDLDIFRTKLAKTTNNSILVKDSLFQDFPTSKVGFGYIELQFD